jgi:imidazolonepropionase
MWDRLLTDCHVATMVAARANNPLGLSPTPRSASPTASIVRVGKRTELAGFRAKEVTPCGGAWVTPGLVDCHTHLVFGGTRAERACHAPRRRDL